MTVFFRRVRTAAALAATVLLVTACSTVPEVKANTTGEGWAPFGVWVADRAASVVGRQQYEPLPPVTQPLTICAILPTASALAADTAAVISAYAYGITSQAAREHVSVRLLQAATDTRQMELAKSCSAKSQSIIVNLVDPELTRVPAAERAALGQAVLLGAPDGSVAGNLAPNKVSAQNAGQATTAAQWVLGQSGGLPSTVALLPGAELLSVPNGYGSSATYNPAESALKRALKSTSLTLVGTYYGADTVAAQRALVLRAMTDHPGLSYIIGTATAATAAGDIFITMNTDRRPQAVALELTASVNDLIKQGGITAAMSSSPVIQGRIALDRAVRIAQQTAKTSLRSTAQQISPIALPVDTTNVNSFSEDWWSAPTASAK